MRIYIDLIILILILLCEIVLFLRIFSVLILSVVFEFPLLFRKVRSRIHLIFSCSVYFRIRSPLYWVHVLFCFCQIFFHFIRVISKCYVELFFIFFPIFCIFSSSRSKIVLIPSSRYFMWKLSPSVLLCYICQHILLLLSSNLSFLWVQWFWILFNWLLFGLFFYLGHSTKVYSKMCLIFGPPKKFLNSLEFSLGYWSVEIVPILPTSSVFLTIFIKSFATESSKYVWTRIMYSDQPKDGGIFSLIFDHQTHRSYQSTFPQMALLLVLIETSSHTMPDL